MKDIVKFLVDNRAYAKVRGFEIWLKYTAAYRTIGPWQSLRATFLESILPNIHNPCYELTDEQIKSFRQEWDYCIYSDYSEQDPDSSETGNGKDKERAEQRRMATREEGNWDETKLVSSGSRTSTDHQPSSKSSVEKITVIGMNYQYNYDSSMCTSDQEDCLEYRNNMSSFFQKSFTKKNELDSYLDKEKPYQCTTCSTESSSKPALDIYMMSSHGEKPHECPTCLTRFRHKSVLDVHKRIHPEEEAFQCTTCSKRFTRQSSLNRHRLFHSEKNLPTYLCPTCPKQFAQKRQLTGHLRMHSGEKPFACPICAQKFTMKGYLKNHTLIHSEEKLFACPNCDKRFSQSSGLRQHLNHCVEQKFEGSTCPKQLRKKNKKRNSKEKLYECAICQKRFTEKGRLTGHLRMHSGEKPFACPTCARKFTMKCYLKTHMLLHSEEKPFACQKCDKRFSQSSGLRQHLNTYSVEPKFEGPTCSKQLRLKCTKFNSEEKPHECVICKKRFHKKGTLTGHLRMHSGEKPFACSTCSQKFAMKCYLKNHMLLHSKEKLFACLKCDKRFFQGSGLHQHFRYHHVEKPFQCSMCQKKFYQRQGLKMHVCHAPKSETLSHRRIKIVGIGNIQSNKSDSCSEGPTAKIKQEKHFGEFDEQISSCLYQNLNVKQEPSDDVATTWNNLFEESFIKEEPEISRK